MVGWSRAEVAVASLPLVVAAICLAAPPLPADAQTSCGDVSVAEPATLEQLLDASACFQSSGQAFRALEALEAALEVASAGDSASAAATIVVRGRLGQAHAALGEHQLAIEHFSEGIATATAAGLGADVAPLLNDLGRSYLAIDESLRGLAAFADSRRLAATPELAITAAINTLRARSESTLVTDLRQPLGEIDAAAARLPDSATKASILLGLAALYRDLAPRSGEHAADLALQAASRALSLALAANDPKLATDAYGEVGAAYAEVGAPDRALAATRQAVLVAQEAALDDSLYRWEWQSARLLRRTGNVADALRAYRSAIDTLGRTQAWLVTSRRAFREDVLPLYEEYADLMLAGARELPDPSAALREVQHVLEQLRVAEVRNYFENQCAVPSALDSGVRPDDGVMVIYPMLFADRAELLVNASGTLLQFTAPVGLARLTAEVTSLRESIQNATDDAYLASAQRLYQWLIEPLEPVLREAAPETLVIVPDGPLRTIPLAVLHDGERFLVERYALATTPGLSLVGAATRAPITRALLSGITAPVQGFPALPFVADELQQIAGTVPARVYSDEDFVTATLEREILAGGYSIVHMATHARFESDYRRSFLLTYDDVLTMDRLEDMMGSQRGLEQPVDLLVLSACQTAVGDERAALGLAGVAVKAGVRSALASLWLISDESTARLIAEFYRQLAQPGNDKADALRGAQLLLMNDAEHRHPAYWAPFLLIGDWR